MSYSKRVSVLFFVFLLLMYGRLMAQDLGCVQGMVFITFTSAGLPPESQTTLEPVAFGVSQIDAILQSHEATLMLKLLPTYETYLDDGANRLARTFVVYYSDETPPAEVASELEALEIVERAVPNNKHWKYYGGTRQFEPEDDWFEDQWNLHNDTVDDRVDIDAPEAWEIEKGDPAVRIGIIDMGTMVDVSEGNIGGNAPYKLHSDLRHYFNGPEDNEGQLVLDRFDLDGGDASDSDSDGLADNTIGYRFNTVPGSITNTTSRRFWQSVPSNWKWSSALRNVSNYQLHGIYVASVAAATTGNDDNIVGVANGCSVYMLRDGAENEDSTITDIYSEMQALRLASDMCQVVNMSWWLSPQPDELFHDEFRLAANVKNTVLVAIAGNRSEPVEDPGVDVLWPGQYEEVLCVGNMQQDLTLDEDSRYGPTVGLVDVVAPVDEGIPADSHTFQCQPHPCPIEESVEPQFGGTSAAAPQAAGVAALVRSRFPTLNQVAVRERIQRSSEKYWSDTSENQKKFGSGKINAYRALTEWGSVSANTTWSTSNTRDGTFYISGDLTIESGATLTINPGVVVKIAPDNEEAGSDPTRVKIIVESGGSLQVLGSANEPVTFESFTDSPATSSDWVGIEFEAGSSGNLEYATIRNAQRAIENYASVDLTNCKFTDCETAIEAHANVTASGTLIANNDVAVDIYSGTTSLTKCTIADNADWAMVTRTGTSLSVNKCVMAFNGGPAVRALSGGTSLASMSNSVVWANENDGSSRTDNDWDTVGTNVYKMDPHFCGTAHDDCGDYGEYCLNAASPAVAPVPPSQGLFGERVGAFDIGCAPSTTIVPSVLAQACPAADAGALQVIVDLEAATRTIPGDEFRLGIQDLVSIVFDSDGILPGTGSAGPSLYQTSIVHGSFGSRSGGPAAGCLCSHNDAADVLLNGYVLPAQASVTIRSPDLDGNGTVNVQDFSKFGYGGFPQNSVPAGDCRDFNGDGAKNIQDYGFYGVHNGHTAQFAAQNVPSQVASSNATVALEFTDEYQTATTHKLFVDVTVKNFAGITTALFALAARNQRLTFSEWREAEGSIGTVIVAPIDRDNEEQHYFGLLISDTFEGTTASLGQLVFDIEGAEPFEVVPEHFVLVTGEVLLESEGGQQVVAQMGGGVSLVFDPATARVYHDRLEQNFPNPFNPITTVAYSLAKAADVKLTIFDVAGRRVRELVNERRERGAYKVVWDGRNDDGAMVSSGVYFYKLVAGSFTDTKKMTIIK